MEGIRDGHEVFALDRDDERFVVAWFINAVLEAKFLERLEDVNGITEPVGIPSDGPLSGNAVDRLDRVGDEVLLSFAGRL